MLQLIMSNKRQSYWFLLLFVMLLISFSHRIAVAQEEPTKTDIDESFDPFTDYNEYEQQTEEEEDINFLKNGRYLTLAFTGGYRGFMNGGFTQAYQPNLNYGVEFAYFFDMQLATSVSYYYGDHGVNFSSYQNEFFPEPARKHYSGSVNIQIMDLSVKYYFNTDNVTKGLADLNPYGIFGTSYYIRTYSLDGVLNVDPDKVWGVKAGGGIEIPILKRRGYLGIQAVFRYVQFPDENLGQIEEDDSDGGTFPIKPRLDGDIFELNFAVGFNF